MHLAFRVRLLREYILEIITPRLSICRSSFRVRVLCEYLVCACALCVYLLE